MSVIVFFSVLAILLGATALGLYFGATLPRHHLNRDSKDVIHAFMDINALLAAVVLGLLVFSAKSSFDTKDLEWKHASANIILLDRLLAQYGPETRPAREKLRAAVERKLKQFEQPAAPRSKFVVRLEDVQSQIGLLSPETDAQHWQKSKALDVSNTIAQARWFLLDEIGSTIPIPFLAVLMFWLAIIFFGHSLFAPRNMTTLGVIFLSAVSLAASVFLIMEMDQSLEGMISISSEPLREAIKELGH